MLRVSGLLYGTPFTGCIRVPGPTETPIVRFDSVVEFHRGWRLRFSGTEIGSDAPDAFLEGLAFHERTQVFLGEFLLGYLVLKRHLGMHWFAEPINHAHLNTFGKPGVVSEPYDDYLSAFGFFNMSVPHPCRSSLRCLDQRTEFDFFPGSKRV